MSSPLNLSELEKQEAHGQYWEEVEMICDGIVTDIRYGHLTCQEEADSIARDTVGSSEWVTDTLYLAVHTLLWSKNACAAIIQGVMPNIKDVTRSGTDKYYQSGDYFPFGWFAESAMQADVFEKLKATDEYRNLPESNPDE